MSKRTPTGDTTDKATRCEAVEGAQQCLSATHHKMQNHRWGTRGETDQWNADGTHKGWWDVPESPTDVLAMQTPSRPEALPAVPPGGVQAAGPARPTPEAGGSEPSGETAPSPAGSGGAGSGRPQPEGNTSNPPALPLATAPEVRITQHSGRSIGTVLAHTAIDTALGVPLGVLDERAHGREATELLLTTAAEHWRHDRLMPAERLLDLEAVVGHMVTARGLRS